MIGDKLLTAVIVKNEFGYTAMLRFDSKFLDRSFSSNTKFTIYSLIERYLMKEL